MSTQVLQEMPYRVPVVACDSLNRAYTIFLNEMLANLDYFVLR